MKILHIAMGSPEFDRAAIELGHQVERVGWRELLGKRFVNGAPSELQRAIMKASDTLKPDLVFAQTHQSEVVSAQTYRALRDNGAFVVNWCGDVREPLPDCYARIAEHVDVMAFSNLTDVRIMRDFGFRSEFLQIGYDPEIYHAGDGGKKRSGIVFLGNHYNGRFPNSSLRFEVVDRMRREFRGQFTVRGGSWPWPGSNPTTPQEEADVYRGALIALNIDHFTRPGFFSDRLLRAMACGCMVVDVGARCTAPDAQDAVDMVRSILSQDRVITAGKTNARWALEHHTWKNRIRTMENWVNGIDDDGRVGPILAER